MIEVDPSGQARVINEMSEAKLKAFDDAAMAAARAQVGTARRHEADKLLAESRRCFEALNQAERDEAERRSEARVRDGERARAERRAQIASETATPEGLFAFMQKHGSQIGAELLHDAMFGGRPPPRDTPAGQTRAAWDAHDDNGLS